MGLEMLYRLPGTVDRYWEQKNIKWFKKSPCIGFAVIKHSLNHRRMAGMVVVSSTRSPSSWPPPENWLCRSMMRRERWAPVLKLNCTSTCGHQVCISKLYCSCSFYILGCLSLTGTPMCGLWWSWYRPADKGVGKRLSPACGHPRASCWHDGERQNWPGLLQVSIPRKNTKIELLLY